MNEKLQTVTREFNEHGYWDDMYVDIRQDNRGNMYAICEDWKDNENFIKKASEILGIDEKDVEYELEIEMVFSDEYSSCDDCGNIIRTSPDSYHWQPDFYVGDGFIVCGDCFRANGYTEDYIKDKINDPKTAINGLVEESDLEEIGFEKFNGDSYENGFHYGQTDKPENVYDELKDRYEEIVFMISEVSQFYIKFDVWVRGEI